MDGDKELEDTFVTVTPLEESDRRRTWGNDVTRETGKSWSWSWTWGFRLGWSSVSRTAQETTTSALGALGSSTKLALDYCDYNSVVQTLFFSKKQWLGHLLFLGFGFSPLIILGYYTPGAYRTPGDSWFRGVFETKVLWCGNNYLGKPQDSTIRGIEGLFVLDSTYGQLSFSRAKTIDVAWDILVGRGVQLMAWWVTYAVFSDALLRVIERHPASFQIFQRIALEGPSLRALYTLCKELWTVNSKLTKALFCFMLLATTHVLCIPMFMGAMTGYDSKTIAWVDPDGTDNMIPTDALRFGWVVRGNGSSRFEKPICADNTQEYSDFHSKFSEQILYCDCKLPNGTMISPDPNIYSYSYWSDAKGIISEDRRNCRFDYPGADKMYKDERYSLSAKVQACNTTKTVKVEGKRYDGQSLNVASGWCYGKTGWSSADLENKSRCLPDTANPSYKWGFSTMLSGVFVLINFIWSIGMYAVWQDAQFQSNLVRSGYSMTPLRAAFAMAKVAKHKTGMGEKQLVRADTKNLEKELYGHGNIKGTRVDYDLFVDSIEDEEEAEEDLLVMRRRSGLGRNRLESQQTLASPTTPFDEK